MPKRFYPKKKINFQSNTLVRKINFKNLKHDKWSRLKSKPLQQIKINEQNIKFEKKWLRRRFNEELRIKQALKFYYGPFREKNFRSYLLRRLKSKKKSKFSRIFNAAIRTSIRFIINAKKII